RTSLAYESDHVTQVVNVAQASFRNIAKKPHTRLEMFGEDTRSQPTYVVTCSGVEKYSVLPLNIRNRVQQAFVSFVTCVGIDASESEDVPAVRVVWNAIFLKKLGFSRSRLKSCQVNATVDHAHSLRLESKGLREGLGGKSRYSDHVIRAC